MSKSPDDARLDENLKRLLRSGLSRPSLSPTQEERILEALKDKQAELFSSEDKPMQQVITPVDQKPWGWIAASVAVAASVFFLVWMFRTEPVPISQSRSLDSKRAPVSRSNVVAAEVAREELDDGTVLIAHRDSEYSIDGRRRISLRKGDVYLIVAKSSDPFVISTGDGDVRALGTRFAVSVTDQTTTAVAQGQVRLSNDQGEVDLKAGQQGTLRQGQRPTRMRAPRVSYLVSWAKKALSQEQRLVTSASKQNGLIAVDPWGQESRLTLRRYDVDIYIEDGIARTTIDQTFFNHQPWNTEGTFYFPLPPDASVSRLAMYVNGRLNEGGMVERSYGQQVYSDIRYQWRDPALLEMMEGNVFKMRVFPLEGRQEKRVLLSYTQGLDELYGTQRYWFPMDHTHSIAKKLSIRVRVKDGANAYQPRSSTHDMDVATDGDDLVLNYSVENKKPDQDFLLHLLPRGDLAASKVTTTEQDGYQYVFGRFSPELPSQANLEPRQWIVLNDTSASRTKIEAQAQRYIIERLIQEADDADTLSLVEINTRARSVHAGFRRMADLRSDHAEIDARMTDNRLGATNLQAAIAVIGDLIEKHKPTNPHVLYLGDGVATDGTTQVMPLVRAIPKSVTFVGVGVGKKVDARFLQSAADQTGGMFTTINPDEDINWRVFDLIAALNTSRLTGIEVSLRDLRGQDIDAVAYPSSRTLAAGETLSIVARCERLPATLSCRGMIGDTSWEFVSSLNDDTRSQADYIPRLWAKRHLDDLLKSGPEHKQAIVELSKQYYVVTPYTSLIVLEDDAMYQKYKVERGRKDHWALYPAPRQIEVVREPVDWSQWGWWGQATEDGKLLASAKPQSVHEIVDSVQFRINAPFYYWHPQRSQSGRFALYELLDRDADPTRLLIYAFGTAAGDSGAIETLRNGSADGTDSTEPPETAQAAQSSPVAAAAKFFTPATVDFARFAKQMGDVPVMPATMALARNGRYRELLSFDMSLDQGLVLPSSILPVVRGERRLRGAYFRLPFGTTIDAKHKRIVRPLAMMDFSLALSSTPTNLPGGLEPIEAALQTRFEEINREVVRFNRQHGFWNGRTEWSSAASSLDLSGAMDGRWSGGLDELVRSASGSSRMPFSSLFGRGEEEVTRPAMASGWMFTGGLGKSLPVAVIGVYDQSLRSQPGSCSVLAADHLEKRRQQLAEKRARQALTDDERLELEAIRQTLANVATAASRIESSSPFWSAEGWNYRPQPWSFTQPTVQAYANYTWSFDLTRYAPGLYSTAFDVLDEVVTQIPQKKAPPRKQPPNEIDELVRQRIEAARRAVQPTRVWLSEDGPWIVVANGDRFVINNRTNMYLDERIVCDGQHVVQLYDELGLAARRPASELRLSSLRQLIPHLIPPVNELEQRFRVESLSDDESGFELKLTPLGQLETSNEKIHLTTFVLNDGRISNKTFFVNGQRRVSLRFEYTDGQIAMRWFDDEDKQLGESGMRFELLAGEAVFDIDLTDYVVFDMPLRKPSYYAQHLEQLGDQDPRRAIELRRHHALALIQDLRWRQWGQTNDEAQKSLLEAFTLLKQIDQDVKLGDLTLLGSAGVYHPDRAIDGKKQYDPNHPVAKYFELRNNWNDGDRLREDDRSGLTGHLAAYHAAVQSYQINDQYESFLEYYGDSPMVAAAAHFRSQWGQKPEAWFRLYDQPAWRMFALLMSANSLKTDEHRERFAVALEQAYREAMEDGHELPITVQLAQQLKATSIWKTIVEGRLERAKQSASIASLLRFAEQAMSWGETEAADEVLSIARERLTDEDSLLGRLALGQSLWAGGRVAEAMLIYQEILDLLEEEKIAASPALLASAARLAQQAGHNNLAIELEEQALALEHEHLPELINIQAFRQRYNWLWGQYAAQLQTAVNAKDQPEIDRCLARAEEAWQRWYEVDHDNVAMMQQMATFQSMAGRDEEAWLYLSTVIDRNPKDAESYRAISQWHQGRNELDEAEQWLLLAYQWDTANPRWLFERGDLLTRLGRNDEAQKLFRQIVDGTWAPGLQGWVEQAKTRLSR